MKTRIQEIPVCDLCSRDGEPYQVSALGGGITIVIVRCDRHIAKLAQEADVDVQLDTNRAGTARRVPVQGGSRRESILTTLEQHPDGLLTNELAELQGIGPTGLNKVVKDLEAEGYLRRERSNGNPTDPRAQFRIFLAEDQVSSNGSSSNESFAGGPTGAPRQNQVLELVKAEPGLHPRDYAEQAGIDGRLVSGAAVRLRDEGLIKITGTRRTARYWPKGHRIPGAFQVRPVKRKKRAKK